MLAHEGIQIGEVRRMSLPPTITSALTMLWNVLPNLIKAAITYVQHVFSQA